MDLIQKIFLSLMKKVKGLNLNSSWKIQQFYLLIVVKILEGNIKKTIMIGNSEIDTNAIKAAEMPVILLEYEYTEKNTTEIYYNHLIKDFIGIEKIITKYL